MMGTGQATPFLMPLTLPPGMTPPPGSPTTASWILAVLDMMMLKMVMVTINVDALGNAQASVTTLLGEFTSNPFDGILAFFEARWGLRPPDLFNCLNPHF